MKVLLIMEVREGSFFDCMLDWHLKSTSGVLTDTCRFFDNNMMAVQVFYLEICSNNNIIIVHECTSVIIFTVII